MVLWMFVTIFGICEFGERLSETFNEINEMYDRLDWYRFPCNVQHTLTILMIFAQKPVELYVFGSMTCGRITFKNVGRNFLFITKKLNSKHQIRIQFFYEFFFRLGIKRSIFMVYDTSTFWKLKFLHFN